MVFGIYTRFQSSVIRKKALFQFRTDKTGMASASFFFYENRRFSYTLTACHFHYVFIIFALAFSRNQWQYCVLRRGRLFYFLRSFPASFADRYRYWNWLRKAGTSCISIRFKHAGPARLERVVDFIRKNVVSYFICGSPRRRVLYSAPFWRLLYWLFFPVCSTRSWLPKRLPSKRK